MIEKEAEQTHEPFSNTVEMAVNPKSPAQAAWKWHCWAVFVLEDSNSWQEGSLFS